MDLNELLRPLEGESPCGSDMMFSVEFDEINEARRSDDPSLAQGEWVVEHKEADWVRVLQLCEDLLCEHTKDIRVAVWMVEASASVRGLKGIAEGYQLLAGLCQTFWPKLHPEIEDGDMEPRIGNLGWLANRSRRLVREVSLTGPNTPGFSTVDFESACAFEQDTERNLGYGEDATRDCRITLAQFDAARLETPPQYFVDTQHDARSACEQVRALQIVLDGFLGSEAPSFAAVTAALEDVQQRMKRYAVEAGVASSDTLARSTGSDAPSMQQRDASIGGGAIRSRAEAIRQLREIAEFFRCTEPHSPVAYLADKAARWGDMSLHEWLRTVVKDDGTLLRVEELLGVEQSFRAAES